MVQSELEEEIVQIDTLIRTQLIQLLQQCLVDREVEGEGDIYIERERGRERERERER